MIGIKKLVAGTAVTAVAGAGLLLGASAAFATRAAPWEPDSQALGTITFYNSAGTVVTSGPDVTNAFAYASASNVGGTDQAGATKASLSYAFPDHTKTTPNFFVTAGGAASNFPVASGPSSITGLGTTPVATTGSSVNLLTLAGAGTNDPTAGYDSVLQVRMFASGGSAILSPTEYWASDVHYSSTTGAWYETYPTVVSPTSTTLGVSASPAPSGTNLTLTATETPAIAGSVNFYDGSITGTPLNGGTPVAVNGSGVATMTISTLSVATHHLVAVFTPTAAASNGISEGKKDAVVTGPTTNTALTVSPTGAGAALVDTHAIATVTLASNSAGVTAGSVQFFDGSTSLGTVPSPGAAGGVYDLHLAGGLSAGGHSVTAVFTPTDPTANAPSTSAAQVFSDSAAATGACAANPSGCTDTQSIEGAIPVGTLTITTPYNGAAAGCAAPVGTSTLAPALTPGSVPNVNSATSTAGCTSGVLNIGTLALTSMDTMFTANTTFQDIVVTDNRSGSLGWTVSAGSSDLTDGTGHAGGTIDSQNVGLTNIVSFNGVGFTGTVTGVDNPAALGVAPGAALGAVGSQGLGGGTAGIGGLAHTIATNTHGPGSVTLNGTITLNAPTSTEAGVFAGTITFTVA